MWHEALHAQCDTFVWIREGQEPKLMHNGFYDGRHGTEVK
jgi:hypothetical protein